MPEKESAVAPPTPLVSPLTVPGEAAESPCTVIAAPGAFVRSRVLPAPCPVNVRPPVAGATKEVLPLLAPRKLEMPLKASPKPVPVADPVPASTVRGVDVTAPKERVLPAPWPVKVRSPVAGAANVLPPCDEPTKVMNPLTVSSIPVPATVGVDPARLNVTPEEVLAKERVSDPPPPPKVYAPGPASKVSLLGDPSTFSTFEN